MESPLALYRRYRPETFAEVIGQEHVTEPLRAALAGNRVNHAYLFSGPRGCGKTTCARILARALNCEKAPVADPCGECDSCRDLGRGGPGSIDVIEIDAAVPRRRRRRAGPAGEGVLRAGPDRYKVYIIDEAHMVSTQGFNALLKLVEEPPEHLRFIFATTEPEKVIATIRSRTHHYPFRLIPPRLLSSYLSELCEKEGVTIEPAALPLVVRAGAGSARDTLSVLDQLIGGAGPTGSPTSWPRRCSATPPTPCSTRRSTRSPRRRRDRLRRRRQGDRDRAGPAPVRRGPAPPAARPGDRARRARRDRVRPDRRPRGPGRAAGRAGRPVRWLRPEPGRRHRRDRAHRDARRHRTAAAARADLRAGAAARRRPHHRRRAGPDRPARAAGRDHRYAARRDAGSAPPRPRPRRPPRTVRRRTTPTADQRRPRAR